MGKAQHTVGRLTRSQGRGYGSCESTRQTSGSVALHSLPALAQATPVALDTAGSQLARQDAMENTTTFWRTDRPTEGFYETALPQDPTRPMRTFLPEQYQTRYAYPLMVMFHGLGGNEEQVLRLAPHFSRRNYIAISLRAPTQIGRRADGSPACCWDETDTEKLTDFVLAAVQQTRRTYHIHSERVYLVGLNEGAGAAYRAAFQLADQVAGVVALNGSVPRVQGKIPLFNLDHVRKQRVFIGQSTANHPEAYMEALKDQKLFYAAGAEVKFARYKSESRLPALMLQSVNKWIIEQINTIHTPAPVLVAR
ncbi:MAG: alpha/beta hydrolase [Fimbriiglobus sp.]